MAKTTNIRQRKNGLWEGRYRLNGKQCAVYGQTKAEAKAKLAARMTEIEQGICIERTDLTLEEWGWEWLKTFKEGKIRHSTMDNYESDFRMHVVPYIGHIKLKDLTTLHIQRTYTKAQQNGLSPRASATSTDWFTGCWPKHKVWTWFAKTYPRIANCPCWKRLRCTHSPM